MEEHRKAIGVLCAVAIIASAVMVVTNVLWMQVFAGLIAVVAFVFVWILVRTSEQNEPNGSWAPQIRSFAPRDDELLFYTKHIVVTILSVAGMVLGTIPGLGAVFWIALCVFLFALLRMAVRYFPFMPPEPGD